MVSVVNSTEDDCWLRSRTRLGVLKPADVLPAGGVRVEVSVNEIVVGVAPQQSSSKEFSGGTDDSLIDLSHFTGTDDERSEVRALFNRHHVVFAQSDDDLECTSPVQHRTRTTDDITVTIPYRRIPPTQLDEVKDHLQRSVRTGAIVESKSDFASAVVLVRKRSGALRMCCDFRALNAKTVKDAFPLPQTDESMDALAGARWFSTLDLQSAYTQVPMHPDDQHKTAFTTPFGLYEHRRMAFGLCNAPATFQRLMQTACREKMFSMLLCYLDDVLVFSCTIAEQLQRLDTVFTRMTEYGRKLELKKCAFCQTEIQYLGHRVSAAGIATDPEKVAAAERWPRPETLKQLRFFMEFASYYRRYVARFTAIASPLNALITTCCRDIKGERRSSASLQLASRWNEKCEEAFSAIKLELTSAPVLGFADYSQPFIVETDASERIIAYASRGIHKSEKNTSKYSSKKLELLALNWAVCDKIRNYLIGGVFILYTDNNPLTYLMRSSKLPAVEQRWAAALAPFNFEIKYRSAKHNANADALSRLTPAAMVSSDVDSCLTRTTKLLAEIHVNVVEAREQAPAIVDDSIGTLPSISLADMRELQKTDDVLQRVIWYRHRGRHPDMRERSDESKATLALLGQRIVEHDGVPYRHITTQTTFDASSYFCHLA